MTRLEEKLRVFWVEDVLKRAFVTTVKILQLYSKDKELQ